MLLKDDQIEWQSARPFHVLSTLIYTWIADVVPMELMQFRAGGKYQRVGVNNYYPKYLAQNWFWLLPLGVHDYYRARTGNA